MNDPSSSDLQSVSLLLADDHALFRDALVTYLQRALPRARMTTLENLHQVRAELLIDNHYDLVLIDWHMPGVGGIDDLVELVRTNPGRRFALMSGVVNTRDVWRVMDAGFCAYLPKTMNGAAIADAVMRVLRGEQFLPIDLETQQPMAAYYADRTVAMVSSSGQDQLPGDVTGREREALRLLVNGMTNLEIAVQMDITEATVKMHLRHAFDKMGVRNRTEAALKCRELGIFND